MNIVLNPFCSGIQQNMANSIPPLRNIQKNQQIHQQYSYSKFQNDSAAEVEWSQVPKQNVTTTVASNNTTTSEGILIDLNEDLGAPSTNLYSNVGVCLIDDSIDSTQKGFLSAFL